MTDNDKQRPAPTNEDTGPKGDISNELPPTHDLVNATYQKEQKGTAKRIIDELKKSS